ncbi:LOW QUALITY PROTEIN: BCL11 transcription factor A-like [Babylonia areolata]|uniref:LOW QUALITY PROTEIN: BCL11 transcription factor A-like n=1 Tax=Babylonia areolata TaxID=304850 RepID=UPI003FCF6BE0
MSSRRKQGRPQQRKTLDSVEPENDLLVCGDCQTSFPLQHIVHFIRHKGSACTHKGSACTKDPPPLLPSPPPHHHSSHADQHSDKPTDLSSSSGAGMATVEEGVCEKGGGGGGGRKKEQPPRRPLRSRPVADVEANAAAAVSEPSRMVCEVCSVTVGSAWLLLQHVQKEHGMKIYSTATPSTSPRPSSSSPASAATAFLRAVPPTRPHPPCRSGDLHLLHPLPLPSTRRGAAHPPTSAPSSTSTTSGGAGVVGSFPGVLAPFFRLPFGRTSELGVPVEVLEQYRGLRTPHVLTGVSVALPPGLDSAVTHAAFDRTRPLTAATLDSSQQTYSQRLKELATNPPHLPAAPVLTTPTAPFTLPAVLKAVQPNAQGGGPRASRDSTGSTGSEAGEVKVVVVVEDSKEKTPKAGKERNNDTPTTKLSSSPASSPATTTTTTSSSSTAAVSSLLHPGKLKTCEFCQKKFRFQSNLIVHRRSHTGERPFRCPLCPHACSQHSKLQRHMKTHAAPRHSAPVTPLTTTGTSDGSTHSTGSSPDSTRHKLCDASDLDEEEEEEEMEEDDEEEDMEGDFSDDSDVADKGCDGSFNPLTAESDGRSDLRSNSQTDSSPPDAEATPPGTRRHASVSLVSEVMKKSGLNSIESFNEAFQAALEENLGQDGAQDLSLKENGDSHHVLLLTQPGAGKTPPSGGEQASKGSEPGDSSVFSPTTFPHVLPADCSPTTTLRTFFPGFPPTFSLQEGGKAGGGAAGAGSSSTTTTTPVGAGSDSSSSALKVPSGALTSSRPVSGASLLAASTNGASPSPGGGSSRKSGGSRNDTCEFCGKVFKNCSNLTVHRRSHTGEKPYKCELCTYACAQSSKLTRHMKTHGRVGKDVFRCRFCDMPFSVPSTLEKHMRKCVENNRDAGLLEKGEGGDGEGGGGGGGKVGADPDSGSQSSPAPTPTPTPVTVMPTLSAQLLQRSSSGGSGSQDPKSGCWWGREGRGAKWSLQTVSTQTINAGIRAGACQVECSADVSCVMVTCGSAQLTCEGFRAWGMGKCEWCARCEGFRAWGMGKCEWCARCEGFRAWGMGKSTAVSAACVLPVFAQSLQEGVEVCEDQMLCRFPPPPFCSPWPPHPVQHIFHTQTGLTRRDHTQVNMT